MSTRTIQDTLDNQYSIGITYIPTGNTISFSGYIDSLKDNYTVNWNTDEVYGRIDPIFTYKSTFRKINIGFNVPSESFADAKSNFKKLQTFLSFSYPVYEKESFARLGTSNSEELETELRKSPVTAADRMSAGNAMLLSRPPLIAVKFSNLIRSSNAGKTLLGKYDSLSYEFDQEQGVFSENGNIIPKFFKVSFDLDVIHTDSIGWEVEGDKVKWRGSTKFPYGV